MFEIGFYWNFSKGVSMAKWWRQLSDLAKKINSDLRPVFTSRKIAYKIKVTETKAPLIKEQCVVYEYKCDLGDAGYVGYTCRHQFQRINEHKHSVMGKHLRDVNNLRNKDLRDQFTILKKCLRKLFIKNKKPTLNAQSDYNKANLFIWQFQHTTLGILFSLINHMHWDLHTYISLYYDLTQIFLFLIWIWEWWHGAVETLFFYIAAFYS